MPNGITELIRKGNKYQFLDILKLGDELGHIHTIESKFHTTEVYMPQLALNISTWKTQKFSD